MPIAGAALFAAVVAGVALRRRIVATFMPAEACAESVAMMATASTVVTEQYISEGVLFQRMGLSHRDINFKNWYRVGHIVAQELRIDHDNLSEAEAVRIYHFYLPVLEWVRQQIAEVVQAHVEAGDPDRAPVIGLSCPQGGGKTTLVHVLRSVLLHEGTMSVALSIDDFYLPHEDLQKVADASPDNPLLQGRGNPGTHDVALGAATLRRLTHWRPGGRVPVPRYDKSARGGAGDRLPPGQWPVVTERPQVVFFEGWCLGFEPVAAAALCDPCLAPVNAALGEQFEAWTGALDALVVVQVEDPEYVYEWRREAEREMKGRSGAGMSDAEVTRFCDRCMPAYRQYLPGLYTAAVVPRQLRLEIGADRAPV